MFAPIGSLAWTGSRMVHGGEVRFGAFGGNAERWPRYSLYE